MDRRPRTGLCDRGELARAVLAGDVRMECPRHDREERAGEQAQRVDEPSGENHGLPSQTIRDRMY